MTEKETLVGYTKTIKEFNSIVRFGVDRNTGTDDVALRGGKGNRLFLMAGDGLNVPAGWTITSDITAKSGNSAVMKEISIRNKRELISLAQHIGYVPLVSIRSGAAVSMPGMMDSILNVGMSDEALPFWATRIGEVAAEDCYRRLVVMFGEVVYGIKYGVDSKTLSLAKSRYVLETGENFPQDMMHQIDLSVAAVFKSWGNDRAVRYRKAKGISDDLGTAVNIQTMVFGNRGNDSGSGVFFTRNVATGENEVMAEFMISVQGEDVVAATSTPMPFAEMSEYGDGWTDIAAQLRKVGAELEVKFNDVQDIEFTVDAGELFFLQTRDAKRTGLASIVHARDFVNEGRLTKEEALARVSPDNFAKANAPQIDPTFKVEPVAKGIPACPGVVTGIVVRTSADAVKAKGPVILVTNDTSPDDLAGMQAAVGVLTAVGGTTSHAAVVAREFNKPTVVGAGFEDYVGTSFPAGIEISICGLTGRVWAGKVPIIDGSENEAVAEMVDWAFEGTGCQRSDVKIDRSTMSVPVTAWLADKKIEKAGLKALKSMNYRGGIVLEIASEKTFRRSEDNVLWDVFGEVEHSDASVVELIDRIVDAKLTGTVVKLDPALSMHADRLRVAGYLLSQKINSLQDLVLADGPIEWNSESDELGKTTLDKIFELKKKAGEEISIMLNSMTVFQAVSEAFKGK